MVLYFGKMKTVVFAEKPSVGRDIARILGARQQGRGFLEGPEFIVTWGIGHLVSLAEPKVQNPAWTRWSLQDLPMLPSNWALNVLPATQDQFETVKSLFLRKDVGQVINAADAGREGELIFRLVYRVTTCDKPVQRLWISSMTDEAIREGFEKLRPGKDLDDLACAADCRSKADWLVGMNFSRCYSKKFDVMLTVGRVQTPTLAMVVKRHLEIRNFKPSDYWEIQADLGSFSAMWFDPAEKDHPTRISDKSLAEKIAGELKTSTAVIKSVTKTKKKLPPPLLYDLTTLQREANSRFGLTAAQTLSIAQTLYEQKKVITYPRTDSRHLSDDIFPTVKRRMGALPPDFHQILTPLTQREIPKPKRVFDSSKVSDHHAIIPTEQKPHGFDSWRKEERNIYDMVVRRFLAAFYPDHEYLSTSVTALAGGHNLKASGRVPLVIGWKSAYERGEASDKPADSSEEGEEDQSLPELKNGDSFPVEESKLLTKQTKPPPHFTEAALLQAMETAGKLVEDEELRSAMSDCGLGTPATRAEIIEKLIRVEYMVRDKKRLTPTDKGIRLISLAAPGITSPELTGSWEKRLADIARGKAEGPQFMTDIAAFVSRIVSEVKALSGGTVSFPQPSDQGRQPPVGRKPGPRPAASSQAHSEPARKGPARAQKTAPKGTATAPTPPDAAGKGPAPTGSPTSPPVPIAQRPSFGVCPACGKGRIIEGNRGFGCDRFREGCSYVVWKEFMGKALSETAIKQLIGGRPTREMKGFRREDGTVVSGKIRMRADRKGIELEESGSEKVTAAGKSPGKE